MTRKAPHGFSRARKAGLHLIGDEQAARIADRGHRSGEKAPVSGENAVARKDGVSDQGGRCDSAALQCLDRLAHIGREARAEPFGIAAIGVRCGHENDVGRERLGRRGGGRDLCHRECVAMISIRCCYQSGARRQAAGDADREVCALAARAGEDDVRHFLRHGCKKALGVGVDAFVQVAGVDIQDTKLTAHGLRHRWVAVPDRRDIVVRIQAARAVGFHQPDAFGAHDVQRALVEQHRRGAEGGTTATDQRLGGRIEHAGAALHIESVQLKDLLRSSHGTSAGRRQLLHFLA